MPVYHQVEQDACGAYVICSDTFFNYKAYMGVGEVWESLPGSSPFAYPPPTPGPYVEDSFRENSHWLKVVIAESGFLAFDLIPLNVNDYYRIVVFKVIEEGNCHSPITAWQQVRHAENKKGSFSSPTYHFTGIKIDPEDHLSYNKAPPLYVNEGETYYIRVLSASRYVVVNPLLIISEPAKSGYILDLSMKTCRFEIGPPPLVTEVKGSGCDNGKYIDVFLNRNIDCRSIEINGTDFSFSPSGEISGALGNGCVPGGFGGLTKQIRLFYEEELDPGEYWLSVQEGDDGNTLLDICYQEAPSPQAIPFTVQKLKDTVDLYICKEAMPYVWNGITFSDTGTMIGVYRTPNVNGCDSATYLSLYTVDSFVNEELVILCDEALPFIWYGGQEATTYGERILKYIFTAEGGCDSIVYLSVLPQEINVTDSVITACEEVEVDGIVFEESTLYIDTMYSEYGCISGIVNYDINVYPAISVENVYIDTGSCSHMYIGDRLIYTDSVFIDTLRTDFGCDSLYVHYDVDITANVEPVTNRMYIQVCDSFSINELVVHQDTTLKFLYKNQYNCDSALNIYYVVIDTLDLEIVSFPHVPVIGELTQIYAASSQPDIKIHYWQPESLFDDQTMPDQAIVITEPVTIRVLAEDSRGCLAVDTLHIHVDTLIKHEAVPNAFSPNGDGLNDVFTINLPNERGREIKSVHIYDRWGKAVFSDYGGTSFYWNGTYGNTGEPAATGVYYFRIVLQYIDGEEKVMTGDVTLIR